MKQFLIRLLSLTGGLFIFAFGIVITLNARVGYTSWDAFNAGVAKIAGISIGTASILVGAVLVVVVALLKEKIGLGTILNMLLLGTFMDIILGLQLLPVADNFAVGIPMLIAGLFIIAIGSYFYIRSGFGAGPRDSLMVALTRRTKWPVGVCRSTIECLVAIAGWMLGGMIGIGTVISMFAIGACVQIVFKLFRFDPTTVTNESLGDTYELLTGKPLFPKKKPPVQEEISETEQ